MTWVCRQARDGPLGTFSNRRFCHQVARTITNLQQQIQQHQRQLAQALLVKPPPPPPHLSLHPSAGKSAMDSFPPHPQAPGLPDLQTKEPQSSPSTFAPYPLGESPWCERASAPRSHARGSPLSPGLLGKGVTLAIFCGAKFRYSHKYL